MKSLTKAIYDRATLYTTPTVYYGQALQATMPYTTFGIASGGEAEYESHGTGEFARAYEIKTVTFTTWGSSDIEVEAVISALWRSFERLPLVLDDGTAVSVYKQTEDIDIDPDPSETGADVWMGILILVIEVHNVVR